MYGLAPYSAGPLGASSAIATEEAKPLGPNHYGAVAFGDIGEFLGTQAVNSVYATAVVTLAPAIASTLVHGISGSCTVALTTVVMIGADPTERTATIAVDSIVTVSLTATIPVYAVGFIAPVVSVSASGNTTVSGTAAVAPRVALSAVAYQHMPISANIVVRPVVSSAAVASPVAVAAIYPRVVVASTGLVVTHARAAIVVQAYVSSTSVTGLVSTVSAPLRAIFSATATHVKSASAYIAPVVSVYGAANHGCAISGTVSPVVSASVFAFTFDDIQLSGAISVPFYPYIRGVFGEDLSYADCAYVLTKQNAISVFQ